MYWTGTEPIGLEETTYISNFAAYGPDYASSPYEIVAEYEAALEASNEVFATPLVVRVVDQYGQTIVTDYTTSVEAAVADPNGGAFMVGDPNINKNKVIVKVRVSKKDVLQLIN